MARVIVTGGTGLVGCGVREVLPTIRTTENCVDFERHPPALPPVSTVDDPKEPTIVKVDGEEWIFLASRHGDLRKVDDAKAIFEKYKPTHVLHLAARVGGLFRNMREGVEQMRENILINDNIMECCREYKVKKLVSCLSTCVFPAKVEYPITEEKLHDGPPHPSNEGYAYAKRIVDVLNRAYRSEYNCCFTSVIPTNVYGPNDNFNLEDGHVIPGLLRKCYEAKKEKKDFVVWGSGKPLRQFIYSFDLAALMIWAVRHYDDEKALILCGDEDSEVHVFLIAIKDVAGHIAKSLGYSEGLKFDVTKSDGETKRTTSNAKLRSHLPNFRFTSFEDGSIVGRF